MKDDEDYENYHDDIFADNGFGQHCISGRFVPQMFEHHCARPDLTDGIGDEATGNIRSGPMHGFEH